MNSWPAVLLDAYVTRRWPLSLVHFVTERCNARCPHCFLDFSDASAKPPELTLAEIEQVADGLGPALLNVNLTGGEPLLRHDLWEICQAYFMRARVASVYINTHGGFPERLQRLLDRYAASGLRRRLTVSVSIDDLPAGHDAWRQVPALFGRAMHSYHLCERYACHGVQANINMTVTPHNAARIVEIYRYLRDESGVSAVTATMMRAAGSVGTLSKRDGCAIRTAYAQVTGLIAEDRARGRLPGFSGGGAGRLLNAKNAVLYQLLREDDGRMPAHPPCPAGQTFVVLGADGAVRGCEMRADAALGHVRDAGYRILDILESRGAEAFRARIRRPRCQCTYECALGISVISRKRFIPGLLAGVLRPRPDGR